MQRPLIPLEDGSLLVNSLTRAIGAGMLYFDDPERLRSTTRRAASGDGVGGLGGQTGSTKVPAP
ncbi:MAG: hypothetical protein ACK5N0_06370 [Synechococcaceae cyanobacterium]